MQIIIYTDVNNSQNFILLKEISKIANSTSAVVFDFDSLFNLLKSKISDDVVIAFHISFLKELQYLDLNRVYLSNTRYIIILSNENEELTSIALSLHPRYLTYSNQGFHDVTAVLNKINQNFARNGK